MSVLYINLKIYSCSILLGLYSETPGSMCIEGIQSQENSSFKLKVQMGLISLEGSSSRRKKYSGFKIYFFLVDLGHAFVFI